MKSLMCGIIVAASALSACGPKAKTNWLKNPPTNHNLVGEAPTQAPETSSPEIEILFVVDNSKSMDTHIANVSKNIDQFVESFAGNMPWPFRVAVTTVSDQRSNTGAAQKVVGQLVQVKKSENENVDGQFVISSTDADVKSLLKHTLKVGTLSPEEGGPVIEELFPPVVAAFNNPLFSKGANSHKVVFFITDAADNSLISPTELYKDLLDRSGEDTSKVLAYAAMLTTQNSSCKPDPGMKRNNLRDFLVLTQQNRRSSNTLDLCSANFGRRLAEIGSEIRNQTISKAIRLTKGVPDFTEANSTDLAGKKGVWVTYGASNNLLERQRILWEVELERGQVGYKYDPETISIHINPEFKFAVEPGGYLKVDYVPLNPASVRRGEVDVYSRPPKKK